MRKTLTAALLAATLGALTACSDNKDATAKDPAPTPLAQGTFAPPTPDGTQPIALTYNNDLVPATGHMTVNLSKTNDQSTVNIVVEGLQPNRDYGAHIHTKPCGANPADAGPHYQNQQDPISPSVDPTYANPHNEIWLDLTTDKNGKGAAKATVEWTFRPGEANAVVLHAQHTSTHPGHAGTAGDRLACLTAAF
ncbi:MAG: superoxide dismutase family protein [Corynebacteriales bacterium]|nr:superoxide dismutase family protein [Mycobacteriales bacterium]